MKRNENYWWLVGVNLGDYIYEGMLWNNDENGKRLGCQYEFTIMNKYGESVGYTYMNYREFKDYISGFDLSEYKKVK